MNCFQTLLSNFNLRLYATVNYLSLLGWNDGTEQEIFETAELVEKFGTVRGCTLNR
jgi:hypothetical protein